MDPISVAGLAIAVAQVIAACLKSAREYVGPSQHSSKYLQCIISDLFSFNGAIKNLQTELEVCEEDQARLLALDNLKEPLETSKRTLELIQNRLEDLTFVRKHVLGAQFDGKPKNYLRALQMSRTLFHEVLQMDQRLVFLSDDSRVVKSIYLLSSISIEVSSPVLLRNTSGTLPKTSRTCKLLWKLLVIEVSKIIKR